MPIDILDGLRDTNVMPERCIADLMSTLIETAVKDLKGTRVDSLEFSRAHFYVRDANSESILSFENACVYLDFDPERIRNGIYANELVAKKIERYDQKKQLHAS